MPLRCSLLLAAHVATACLHKINMNFIWWRIVGFRNPPTLCFSSHKKRPFQTGCKAFFPSPQALFSNNRIIPCTGSLPPPALESLSFSMVTMVTLQPNFTLWMAGETALLAHCTSSACNAKNKTLKGRCGMVWLCVIHTIMSSFIHLFWNCGPSVWKNVCRADTWCL